MFHDRVKETTTTTGTGNLTLAGAVANFRAFQTPFTVRPAVTHTLGVSTQDSTGGTSKTSGAFTPAADDLLVAFVGATACVAPGRMTDSQNLGWWKVPQNYVKNTSADTAYCFIAQNPAAASSMTVTFDNAEDSADGHSIVVIRVAGMSRYGADAARQWSGENNQGADAPNPVFAVAALTGNNVLGLVFNATNTAGMTAPASWTELDDKGYATPTTGTEVAGRVSGETGTTITWGSSSASSHCSLIVELDVTMPPGSKYSIPYVVALGTEWEVGRGYLSATTTFVRETVESSSNSGALVSFSAGTKDIFCDVTAVDVVGPGRLIRVVKLEAGTTGTLSALTRNVRVRMVGGGGGGGSLTTSGGSYTGTNGGGGAGAYAEATFRVTPSATYTYAIGAAGAASGNGGNTTFTVGGVTVTAPGGSGKASVEDPTITVLQAGGAGGAAPTNANVIGVAGNPGEGSRSSGTGGDIASGAGASGPFGAGGASRVNSTGDGTAGTGYGSGGSGAVSVAASGARTAGVGTLGLILLEELT